jgi:probable rRNA maturation factor
MHSLQRLTDWLGTRLETITAPQSWAEVSVVLVDDAGITRTNREYFGKDRPTDVISFRYDPVPGEKPACSGDVLVNVDRAVQAGPRRKGIDYELALYIAHCFNHLSGADDHTPEQRKRMRAVETAWLRAADADGLLKGLIR